MSENERSDREAYRDGENPATQRSGHNSGNPEARRQEADGEPRIPRTQRRPPESQPNDAPERTSANRTDDGPHLTPEGNLSETGSRPSTEGQKRVPGSGMPPMGCTRTAGIFLCLTTVVGLIFAKHTRR